MLAAPMQTRPLFAVGILTAALGVLLTLRAVSSAPSPALAAPSPPAPQAALQPTATVTTSSIAGAEVTPEITTLTGDDAFRLLVFDVPLAGAQLRVRDVGMSRDLAHVLAESGASLVVNGGFFDPAERPEGLVISAGATLSPRSDTLGGGVVALVDGRASLAAAEGFVAAPRTDFAIQARPRLVVDGKSGIARDDGRAAERTAICVREQGRALEVIVARGEAPGRGPTLALLADMLVSRGCEGALNLDGGPSTGVAWREHGEVRGLAPRGPVRHAIAVWVATSGE